MSPASAGLWSRLRDAFKGAFGRSPIPQPTTPPRPPVAATGAAPPPLAASSLILPPLPDDAYPRRPRRRRWQAANYDTDGAAPLAPHGPAMEAVKQRLLTRARDLGFATTAEPDLRLSIDGQERRVREVSADTHLFDIPSAAQTLRLLSRIGVPREMFADSHDDRPLGVFVGRLVVFTPSERREIALDDLALRDGWYPVEIEDARPFRWTNGDAALPVVLAGLQGEITLLVEVRRTVPSWA